MLLPYRYKLFTTFSEWFTLVSTFTTGIYVVVQIHTCAIFFDPDREMWDSSEGDWGLR